jgi:anti-sigma B factor antagonist
MARLRLSTRKHDEIVAVAVAGELDIATTPALKSYLHKILLADPGQVIVDLGGVSFIDAAGLGALVTLKERAERQHAALRLADVPAAILRLMKVTRLDSHFDFLPAVDGHGAAVDGHGAGADAQPRVEAVITLLRGASAWTRRSPHTGGAAS